jgi:multidrug transporter EmrE-like cation transporter
MSDRLSLSQVAGSWPMQWVALTFAQASAGLLVFAEPLSMRLLIGIVLILCGLFFIAG